MVISNVSVLRMPANGEVVELSSMLAVVDSVEEAIGSVLVAPDALSLSDSCWDGSGVE